MRLRFNAAPLRYLAFPALIVALALIVIVGSAAAAGSAGSASAPSLTLIKHASSTTVGGRHFRPSTRVRVTMRAEGTATRVVRTGSAGSFSVTFAVPIDQCGGYSVSAVQGTRAVILRSPAKPMCAPALPSS
jgi:hypothetical protein